jgi:hypothetical protein
MDHTIASDPVLESLNDLSLAVDYNLVATTDWLIGMLRLPITVTVMGVLVVVAMVLSTMMGAAAVGLIRVWGSSVT